MKRYLILLFLAFIALGSQAQNFNGGVMAGIAATQVAGDTYSGFKKAGLFFGGFINFPFTEHSQLQMELQYFQKGARHNYDPTKQDQRPNHLFRVNYVELPILYQYKFNDRVKMEAGPSFGFLTSYIEKTDELVISDDPGYNKPAFFTFQLNFGIYVALSQNFAINFRTNNSFANIRTENVTGDVHRIWTYGQFNDSLVLALFYTIRRKK